MNCYAAAFLLFGTMAALCPAGENLLTNPGFETGLTHWGSWGGKGAKQSARSDGTVPEGKQYLQIEAPESQTLVSHVEVAPETEYSFSGKLKGEGVSVGISVFYRDADGKYLGERNLYQGASVPDWFQVRSSFLTPKKCAQISIGLQVSKGKACFDALELIRGSYNQGENELFNSAFQYSNRDDLMPDFWSSGGGMRTDTFSPEFAAGKVYFLDPAETSPVAGTKVLCFNAPLGCRGSGTFPIPLAHGKNYTFSAYVKTDVDNGRFTVIMRGLQPDRKTFSIGKQWTRIEFTGLLKTAANVYSLFFDFHDNKIWFAAPQLEAGDRATVWKPNRADCTFPRIMKGRPGKTAAPWTPRTVVCPEAEGFDRALVLRDFYRNAGEEKLSGRFQTKLYRNGGMLHVALEAKNGSKPSVSTAADNPQFPGNDLAELFLSPRRGGAPYWHFMGGRNGANVCYEGAGGKKLAISWKYRATETPEGWRAEFTIPLDLIPLPGEDLWRLSVCTTDFDRMTARNYSVSGPKGYHHPEGFLYVRGLPVKGKITNAPVRCAVSYSLYMKESEAELRMEYGLPPFRIEVRDETGKTFRRTTSKARSIAIALTNLPDGFYEVVVTDSTDHSARTVFQKAPFRSECTRVNRFRQFIEVDGKAFFPIIFPWTRIRGRIPTEYQLAELKKHHFNTILICPELFVRWVSSNSPARRREVVDVFIRHGFKLLFWGAGPQVLNGPDSLILGRKAEMDEFKGVKNILGWYLADEIAPQWEKQYNLKETDYAKVYRELKKHDPYTLQFINWNDSGFNPKVRFYASENATDLFSVDIYPYSRGIGFGALERYERSAALAAEMQNTDQRPGFVWLQTYAYHEGLREPHQKEYANNVCVSLIHYQIGYMHFINRPESNELWDGMGKIYGAAAQFLSMTGQSGSAKIASGKNGALSYTLWRSAVDGSCWLVLANTSYAQGAETLDFSAVPGLKFGQTPVQIGGYDSSVRVISPSALQVETGIAGSGIWRIF